MKKILRIGGYARVSHEEQKKFGYSISTQVEAIEQWCKEKNYQLVKTYIDEGFSAGNMNRPQLQEMLKDLKHLDAIVFTRLDRLTRNVFEANKILQDLTNNNVSMITISEDMIDTSTANGLFIFNLKVNLAERELNLGSERIKAVFDYKVKNGQAITGTYPLGYKVATIGNEKKVVKDPETMHIVEDMFDYFLTHQSAHKTCKYLNEKYKFNRSYQGFVQLLKSEFYTGKYRDNENYTEPYITKETHEKILDLFKKNIRIGTNRNTYLFSGLIRCPLCHYVLNSHTARVRDKKYAYYRCPNRYQNHYCDCNKQFSEALIEKYLIDNANSLISRHISSVERVKPNETDNTQAQLKDLKAEIDNLNYMFMKKRISVSVYDKLYEELEEKMSKLQSNAPKKENIQLLHNFLNSGWLNTYHDMSKESKRSLWRNIIKEIKVNLDNNIEITFL